jgi:hypothetical protein
MADWRIRRDLSPVEMAELRSALAPFVLKPVDDLSDEQVVELTERVVNELLRPVAGSLASAARRMAEQMETTIKRFNEQSKLLALASEKGQVPNGE